MGGRALSDIYIDREKERQRGEEAKRKARGDEKEGDEEKGIRAGITLGDCGIVNPCRVALVLLLFLSPALSLFVCLFSTLFTAAHPFYCLHRPPPFSHLALSPSLEFRSRFRQFYLS